MYSLYGETYLPGDLILIGISFFILFLSVDMILYPDSIIMDKFIDDHEIHGITNYELDYTQNETDYSYQIDVTKVTGPKLNTDVIRLELHELMFRTSLPIEDYKSNKEFQTNKSMELSEEGHPYIKLNLSTSITYFDSDEDNYLSKGDYFIISIWNMDSNKSFNYSHYKYEQLDFNIFN